ncbi:MAG: hypothetical protein ACRCVT_13600 [Leadbetterella sp.]
MTTIERELWQKIQDFQFDKPNVKLTFVKRLSRENNFTEAFTNEIIEEYRKYIFLCCISNEPNTPSHYVDLVWHLHLTYTKSYWIDLCKNTLGKDIHHNPTEGGKTESDKFKKYYSKTLYLYTIKFRTKPPVHIWQNEVERFKVRPIVVNKNTHWIIPKLVFPNVRLHLTLISLVTLCSILLHSCYQNETDVSPLFFVLIIGIIIYILINLLGNSKNTTPPDTSSPGGGSCSDGFNNQNSDDDDNDSNDGDNSYSGDSGCSGCGGGD